MGTEIERLCHCLEVWEKNEDLEEKLRGLATNLIRKASCMLASRTDSCVPATRTRKR